MKIFGLLQLTLLGLFNCYAENPIEEGELLALAIVAHADGNLTAKFLLSDRIESGLLDTKSAEENFEVLMQNRSDGLQESTVRNFLADHEDLNQPRVIHPRFPKITLITEKEFESYFENQHELQKGWLALFEDFGGVIPVMWTSRVSFNDERTQALIWVHDSYGPTAGKGFYYMLTKLDRTWAVKQLLIPHLIH